MDWSGEREQARCRPTGRPAGRAGHLAALIPGQRDLASGGSSARTAAAGGDESLGALPDG